MKNLIEFFLARRFLVNLLCVFVVIVGIFYLRALKRDLIPPMSFKGVSIFTSFPGASALQVEKFVTEPIENSISGLKNLKEINSKSMFGRSEIELRFDDDTPNMTLATSEVEARIQSLRNDFPSDVETPQVFEWKADSAYFRSFAFKGIDHQNESHRDYVQDVSEAFMEQAGVVSYSHDLSPRSLNVNVDPQKLALYELNMDTLLTKLNAEINPHPVAEIDKSGRKVSVELQSGVGSIKDLRSLILRTPDQGKALLLSDVATVDYRYEEKNTIRLLDGQEFLSMTLRKAVGTDIVDLNEESDAILAEWKKKAPEGVELIATGQGAEFVKKQLDVLRNNAAIGLILVLLTLGFFLGFRVALMTAIGLPLSYLGTFIVLHALDISVNLISLIAMILIVGILVDDAIVVAERYTSFLQKGKSRFDAAREAALSMLSPVTAGIITTMIAFSPIIFVGGWMTEVMISIPIVVISALAISWLEGFFILPEHLKSVVNKAPKERQLMIWLQDLYSKLLNFTLRYRYLFLLSVAGVFASAIFLVTNKIRTDFSLSISDKRINIYGVFKEEMSREAILKELAPLSDYLNSLIDGENVKSVYLSVGDVWMDGSRKEGNQHLRFDIYLNDNSSRPDQLEREYLSLVKEKLPEFKSNAFDRLNAQSQLGTGQEDELGSMYTLNFVGSAAHSFESIVEETKKTASQIDGYVGVSYDLSNTGEAFDFRENPEKLDAFGLSKASLAMQLRALVDKHKLGTVNWQGDAEELSVSLSNGTQPKSIEELSSLNVQNRNALFVPLSAVGSWSERSVQKVWQRKDKKRTVSLNVKFDQDQVRSEDFKKALEEKLPALKARFPGYEIGAVIADKRAKESREWILRTIALCVLGIFFVLAIQFNSLSQPLLVCTSILFGFVGAIWAVFLHGHQLQLMGMIGLLGVAGIAVNSSVIMVDHINRLVTGKLGLNEIHKGACDRLRPIVLTTITTLGGLFPMAYAIGGDSGFTRPMALSMAWGLASATLLTLFAIPSFIAVNEDIKSFGRKTLSRLQKLSLPRRRKKKQTLVFDH